MNRALGVEYISLSQPTWSRLTSPATTHWRCAAVYLVSFYAWTYEPYLTFPSRRNLAFFVTVGQWEPHRACFRVRLPSESPRFYRVLSNMLAFLFLYPFVGLISAKCSAAHESIGHARYYTRISFPPSPFLPSTPPRQHLCQI